MQWLTSAISLANSGAKFGTTLVIRFLVASSNSALCCSGLCMRMNPLNYRAIKVNHVQDERGN